MPAVFHIPSPLRQFTEDRSSVQLDLSPNVSLRDALHSLFAVYPGLRDRILTESGQLRQHVSVFIGKEDVRYTGGLTSVLPANAEITIVPAISGG